MQHHITKFRKISPDMSSIEICLTRLDVSASAWTELLSNCLAGMFITRQAVSGQLFLATLLAIRSSSELTRLIAFDDS